ncbi:MAG: MTH895/ArsE family thioredoxin-like protein [Candidatus Bilamarchaeaceae archaeon]
MKIEILGSGCMNCKKLEENARKAVEKAGKKAEIVKVTDFGEIASYGVMRTPALVIDGTVKSAGTIPIVQALMAKGMATGTALVLMMSITALSFPQLLILRKVIKIKLLALLVAILAAAFIITGYIFNFLIG